MIILDTDTCIEILRGNHQVIARRASENDDVSTTWITAAELYFGAAKSNAPENNRRLVSELLATLAILDFNLTAVQIFGELKTNLQRQGLGLADADLLIASIVLAHRGTLITGNIRHFNRIEGIRIIDWIRG